MDLFKMFYLITYIYPFQIHVISIELLNGQNLHSCEPLHFFLTCFSTLTDLLSDILSCWLFAFFCNACRMYIDACDIRFIKG